MTDAFRSVSGQDENSNGLVKYVFSSCSDHPSLGKSADDNRTGVSGGDGGGWWGYQARS